MNYSWASSFRSLFDRCLQRYRAGDTAFDTWFPGEDSVFLKEIGYRPREFFDFVEDHANFGGEPSPETALLVAAVRRDYFRVVQGRKWSTDIVTPEILPPKNAELDGIPWLPRILAKARAKLRGEMDPDIMFGCGGDRSFLQQFDLHPADFLREVWAADDDAAKMLSYVRGIR